MTSSMRNRELIASAVDADPCHRIIITHGTDTMPETAAHLIARDVVKKKTVVLTGALLPALFAATDAIFNIGCAPLARCSLFPDVSIAMNGRIFDGARVRKNRDAGRFEEI